MSVRPPRKTAIRRALLSLTSAALCMLVSSKAQAGCGHPSGLIEQARVAASAGSLDDPQDRDGKPSRQPERVALGADTGQAMLGASLLGPACSHPDPVQLIPRAKPGMVPSRGRASAAGGHGGMPSLHRCSFRLHALRFLNRSSPAAPSWFTHSRDKSAPGLRSEAVILSNAGSPPVA